MMEEKTKKYVHKQHPQVGAQFVIVVGNFQFKIDINAADLVELLWATDVTHYTNHALFSPEEQKEVTKSQCRITTAKNRARKVVQSGGSVEATLEGQYVVAYACSSQITLAVVEAMKSIMDMQGNMDDEAWESYHPTIAGSYDEQLERKIDSHHKTHGSALKYL